MLEVKNAKKASTAWIVYAASSGVVVAVAGGLVSVWLGPPERAGLWAGLVLAWAVQALAFAILVVSVNRSGVRLIVGWVGGTFLRLATLVAAGVLIVAGRWPYPSEASLLALAGGIFGLLLLEPVILRSRRLSAS